MKKMKYLPALLLSLVIIAACLSKPGEEKRPNVILIVIDALRADHLGCYGYHRNTSPEIEKLAKEGIIFKNMYAQSSWTRPGTASILSGLFPKNHGANTNKDPLPGEVNLLPEILGEYGYHSYAFVGNTHVSQTVGFNQGFKEFFYFQEKDVKRVPNIYVRSDELNDSLSPFIRQLDDTSNNFIYIHYMDPHHPYLPKEKHFSKENKKRFTNAFSLPKAISSMNEEKRRILLDEAINAYDDEILYNDKMVGNLVQMLKRKNMDSNSIIIITSDHGEEFFEHGNFTHGKSLYDEQLKVPLIIRVPGKTHKTINEIANQVDILPTVLSLLEIPIPKSIDGIDLLKSKRTPNLASYAELSINQFSLSSIQTSKHKLIEGVSFPYGNNDNYKWFKERALIEADDDSLELVIKSFYKNRNIRVLSDGVPIDTFTISTEKQVFNIRLPGSKRKKMVTIESLTPCQVPRQLKISDDKRCLAFCIFNSRNVNVKRFLSGIYKEYYTLTEDPGEKNNRYDHPESREIITLLKKNLKKYLLNKKGAGLSKKPVKFSKEQIKALKTLGYM